MAQRYRDEIFIPIVVPYNAAIGDELVLMDDNARSHHAQLVNNFLFEDGILQMDWPAYSLIEYVWDILGRSVSGHTSPPKTIQQLERSLLQE